MSEGAAAQYLHDRDEVYRNVRRSTQLLSGPGAQHDAARRADGFPLARRDARTHRARPRASWTCTTTSAAPPRRSSSRCCRPRSGCRCCAPAPASRPSCASSRGASAARPPCRSCCSRTASRARCATACGRRWPSPSGSHPRGTVASTTRASASTPSTTGSTARRRGVSPPPNMRCSPGSSTRPAPPAPRCRAVWKAKSRRRPPHAEPSAIAPGPLTA